MADKCKISFDVSEKKVCIEVVNDTTGERVLTFPSIELDAASATFNDLQNKQMKIMILHFKDATTCQPMKMAVLGTEPETDSQSMSGGTAATSADRPTS